MTKATSRHDPKWVFERVNPMGGARATAWQDTLEGSDLSSEARIARESIQNSVDATLPREKTEVLVWEKTLSDEEISVLKTLLDLESSDSPTGRLPKLGLKDGNSFERMKRGGKIRVTIIEDRRTCGLGFDENDGKDRFEELCLFLGQESTEVDSSRGGSYGFGKTVYQAASDCRTFLVYSVFEPTPETSQHHARLFGCSSFDGHTMDDDKKYTGRAWFGIPESKSGQEKCSPVVDEDAHNLAKRLGFIQRDRNDFGTSIMIVGSEIDMDKFKGAVEDYWWPRILSDRLFVDLWEGNERVLSPPEPRERSELKPYIRCYDLVEETNVPPKESERRHTLNTWNGKKRGTLALVALPQDDPSKDDKPENDTQFKNTVALIRSGPRMVVQYFDTGGRQQGDFAGVFLSHPDSERALHLSEPPSHDAWNSNSRRLDNSNSDDTNAQNRKLVKSIIDSIKSFTRKFQKDLNPNLPPKTVEGTRRLEQILAGIMSAKIPGSPSPPPPKDDPFQIRIDEGRTNTTTASAVTTKIEIKLKDDAPFDNAPAIVSVRPTVVVDDDLRRTSSERLNLSDVVVDGDRFDIDGDSDIPLRIFKDRTSTVEIESEQFDRDMYADLEVSVRIEDSNPQGTQDDSQT